MPESRRRKREKSTSYQPKQQEALPASGKWLPITSISLMCFGLLWLIIFYIAGSSIPLVSDLGNWNIAVGMGFIVAGFILLTRWR